MVRCLPHHLPLHHLPQPPTGRSSSWRKPQVPQHQELLPQPPAGRSSSWRKPQVPQHRQLLPQPPAVCALFLLAAVVAGSFDFVVKPEFGERASELNITGFVDQTGRLPCTVKHLAGKRVSWIRGRDLQVLSTGRSTVSTDLRISVLPGSTQFKTRQPRSPSSQHSLDSAAGLANGTIGDSSSIELPKCHHSVYYPGRKCVSFVKEYDFVRDTSSSSSTQNFFEESKHRQDEDFHIDTRRRRYNKRKTQDSSWPRAQDFARSSRSRRDGVNDHHQHYHHHYSKNQLHLSGHKHAKRDKPLGKHSSGEPQAPSPYNSPIAIYPQGPFTQGLEKKGAQPGPNYIEGVWEPEDYTLQIKYLKVEDAGTYICQINTEPRISQVVHLSVVKMRAEIIGSNELYVKAGTPVTLACRVNHGSLMPGFILWYKGERLVEYDMTGGRIQVVTEAEGVSHLLLRDAHLSDSGNYTCSPSGGAPASLVLQVIVDERQAAMQQGNSAASACCCCLLLLLLLPAAGLLLTLSAPTFDHPAAAVCLAVSSLPLLCLLQWLPSLLSVALSLALPQLGTALSLALLASVGCQNCLPSRPRMPVGLPGTSAIMLALWLLGCHGYRLL